MRTHEIKKHVAKMIIAASMSIMTLVSVMPSSFAAATMDEMAQEVPMYNPKTKEFFLVENQDIADESILTDGWLQVTPESLDTHIPVVVKTAADVKAGKHDMDVPIRVGKNAITAEQAVGKAYAMYLQAGLDSNAAFQRVQGILSKITAKPGNYKNIVSEDLKTLGKNGNTKKTAEQAVQELYAQLVHQGFTSDQAMAQVNAQLPTILAQHNK